MLRDSEPFDVVAVSPEWWGSGGFWLSAWGGVGFVGGLVGC